MITLKEHNVKPYGELCAMLAKEQKCAYVAATGTGKSYVVGKYIEDREAASDTLILVPSREIKHNWEKLIPGVSVITYQALCQDKTRAEGKKLIVCDEMHHLGAKKWGSVYAEAIEDFTGKLIGITATPIRFLDNSRNMTEECFDSNIVEGLDLPAAISAGVLPTFEYITALFDLPSRIPDKKHRNQTTEKLFANLDFMESAYSIKGILKRHMDFANHRVAVFVNSISEIQEIKGMCSEIYPNASHYIAHSKMDRGDFKSAVSGFQMDKGMSFIYTVNILNEGVHISGVDTIIMFRKTESPIIYLQQLGRALSADMAGQKVRVFDFVANHQNLKAVQGGSQSIIRWVQEGIQNPKYQIVVDDYAIEELKTIEKIYELTTSQLPWNEEEDRLIVEMYGDRAGRKRLYDLLPGRTKGAIMERARKLGLSTQPNQYPESLNSDIKKYYAIPEGMDEIRKLYPEVPTHIIRARAKKLGLVSPNKDVRWTESEDEILRNNAGEPLDVLQTLLPGRTGNAISIRKKNLNLIFQKRTVWTEEMDQIIIENQWLSDMEIKKKYFPDIRAITIGRRRHIGLGLPKYSDYRNAVLESVFKPAYEHGGVKEVQKLSEFSKMSRSQIKTLAQGCGASFREKREPWTEAEDAVIKQFLATPEEIRPAIRTLTEKLPGRTYLAVKQRVSLCQKKEATHREDN